MANPEHVAKLMEGVAAWSEWQAANPLVNPNLRDADLSGMYLQGAAFRLADLGRANLAKADLKGVLISYREPRRD